MRQYQLVVGGIERYAVALLDLALKGFLGNKILDLVGNSAAQRAGTVNRIKTSLSQMLLSGLGPIHGDLHILHAGSNLAEHAVGNLCNLVLIQTVEHDDVVDTVEELRTNRGLEFRHNVGLDLLKGALCSVLRLAVRKAKRLAAAAGDLLCADVGGHDDDGILEVYMAALTVGQDTIGSAAGC